LPGQNVYLSPEEFVQFYNKAKAEGKTSGEKLRELVQEYLKSKKKEA